MVATRKKNGDVRICLDPRDLNKALHRPHYPMLMADDVASMIGNAKVFSTPDAKAGFWQIRLEKKSSMGTTFSTPFGRYRFLRMPFCINTASEVFQQTMEQLFEGYPYRIIVDDILVWGATNEEHNAKLKKILDRVREFGLKLNFRVTSVTFVGHKFTEEGLQPDPEKTDAIREMPPPEDRAALLRFLGMMNYLSKFIKTSIVKPMFEVSTTDIDPSLRTTLTHPSDVRYEHGKSELGSFDVVGRSNANPLYFYAFVYIDKNGHSKKVIR